MLTEKELAAKLKRIKTTIYAWHVAGRCNGLCIYCPKEDHVARLPNGEEDSEWQITDIGNDVCIIKDSGLDTELVLFRFNMLDRNSLSVYLARIQHTNILTDDQKYWASFWLGYFYAHFIRPLPGS